MSEYIYKSLAWSSACEGARTTSTLDPATRTDVVDVPVEEALVLEAAAGLTARKGASPPPLLLPEEPLRRLTTSVTLTPMLWQS